MATLLHKDIDDFVELTLPKIEKEVWVDISMPLQKYSWGERWLKKKPERGGPYLEWKLEYALQGSFKPSGLYAVERTNKRDVMTHGRSDWTKQTANWIYDIDEPAFQSGPERIIEEMKLGERGMLKDVIAGMETYMWSAPSISTQDPMTPKGIPFWIQKYSSGTNPGFSGGDPSGFTLGAGNIATATYDQWKNYCGTYAAVSRDDLIEKVVNACDYCDFKAPVPGAGLAEGSPEWGFYTVHSVVATMRKLMEANNDNLGREVAWGANGEILLRSNPVVWIPSLDNSAVASYDSTNPFYGINWGTLNYYFKTGRNMLKLPPRQAPNQPTVRIRTLINWGDFVCYNRRSNFVFSVAA